MKRIHDQCVLFCMRCRPAVLRRVFRRILDSRANAAESTDSPQIASNRSGGFFSGASIPGTSRKGDLRICHLAAPEYRSGRVMSHVGTYLQTKTTTGVSPARRQSTLDGACALSRFLIPVIGLNNQHTNVGVNHARSHLCCHHRGVLCAVAGVRSLLRSRQVGRKSCTLSQPS